MTDRRSEFRRMARPAWVSVVNEGIKVVVLLVLIYILLSLVFGGLG